MIQLICIRDDKGVGKMHWYFHLLAHRPYFVIVFITIICGVCMIVSFTIQNFPNFSDPTLGFETRGTKIGKRLIAWYNLLQNTGPGNDLVANPSELRNNYKYINPLNLMKYDDYYNGYNENNNADWKRKWKEKRKRKRKKKKKNHRKLKENPQRKKNINAKYTKELALYREHLKSNHVADNTITTQLPANPTGKRLLQEASNETFVSLAFTWNEVNQQVPLEGYFCDAPDKKYSHFVVERKSSNANQTLLDLNGMLAICHLQEQIMQIEDYDEHCHRQLISNTCCRPWSLANYAAYLSNKSSCFDLTTTDIKLLENLLINCYEYYRDLKLSNDCNDLNKCYAPSECIQNNIVFNILHYLTDYNFLKSNAKTLHLKYTMIFVPIEQTSAILPLFHQWEQLELKNDVVQVAAMDLGLESDLFNELLLTDVWLVALGGLFVMTCIWLYTSSLFITLMTCVAVVFSLSLAYFLYTIVFQMSFFPYMNLLAFVVIVGIGADDAFIFIKMWQCILEERFSKSNQEKFKADVNCKRDKLEVLEQQLAWTVHHAALSMFVTSITTAVAFYASYTSHITAIKCFGIFAGTTVITNYLLMISWLPASLSVLHRWQTASNCSVLPIHKLWLLFNKTITGFSNNLEKVIVRIVLNNSYLWFLIFGILGLGSVVVVLYKPGLQLPESSHFQLFVSHHPFEIYNSRFKQQFWFEKSLTSYENFKMPLRFVWGIKPLDDGDYTNPYAYGNLHYNSNFNVTSKAAQLWLWEFCQDIKKQKFYQPSLGNLLPDCFLDNFLTLMDKVCFNDMDSIDRSPCCNISKFPYQPAVFQMCLPQVISSLYATPRQYFLPGVAGPRFGSSFAAHSSTGKDKLIANLDANSYPSVKALIIEFESNISYSTMYHEVKEFVETLEKWFDNKLQTAPIELQDGWFTSELKFFDVQDTLSRGTLIAMSVAMAASLVVLLLVTGNVLVSLYAVITVSLTIFVTLAVLVLLGWKLNILESITVSTAIGLAVDFSLHYSIHYRLSPVCERQPATQFAIYRIVGPTAMAAVTTSAAGSLMLFSNVLPYIQIGIFLVVVMPISWLYATFFLISLLKLYGPQNGFLQFRYPHVLQDTLTVDSKYQSAKIKYKDNHFNGNESLLKSRHCGTNEPLVNLENHEMKSLASNQSLSKPIFSTQIPTAYIETHITDNHHMCSTFNMNEVNQVTNT